jgi:hypothetical protein
LIFEKNDELFVNSFYADCQDLEVKLDSNNLEVKVKVLNGYLWGLNNGQMMDFQGKDYEQCVKFLKFVYGVQTKRKKSMGMDNKD